MRGVPTAVSGGAIRRVWPWYSSSSPWNFRKERQLKIAWRMGDMLGCADSASRQSQFAQLLRRSIMRRCLRCRFPPSSDARPNRCDEVFAAWRKSVAELKAINDEIDGAAGNRCRWLRLPFCIWRNASRPTPPNSSCWIGATGTSHSGRGAPRSGCVSSVSARRSAESIGICPVAGGPPFATHGARGRQSGLAGDIRQRACRNRRGFWHACAGARISRAARLAGGGFHGARLEPQALDSHDRDQFDVPAVIRDGAGMHRARSAEIGCWRAGRDFERTRKSSATSRWRRPA